MKITALLLACLAAAPVMSAGVPISKDAMVAMLKTLDERQRNQGDWKALIYMEQKERDKADVAYEALVFRRDTDEKFLILFTKPKAESGKGYLRMDKNLWMYDPTVGKWERRTERERIGGTDSRREDLDESRLAIEYEPADKGEEKLGVFTVRHLALTAKPGIDVAYPVIELWIDTASGNTLKRQDFALSGRLMRTAYYPKWQKIFSQSKNAEVWYPMEMRFYDEVDKANSTIILMKAVDLRPLEANIFTKAWLESKSR
jgi:outer membrane lipoprotein-sorting protein